MRAAHSDPDSDPVVRRLAFLAQAGEVLSSSLDYEETLQHLALIAVPALGDMCIVDVVEDGQLRRLAAAHAVAAKSALIETLRRRYPATPGSPQPAARVMRSGEPELLATVTPEVIAAHVRDADHAALILAIGIRSHIAVPLIARGAIVGVISLGVTESDVRYTPDDLAFARDLARLAALAIDNARLFRASQDELVVRRRAEEALRLSEGRFRAVMEQSPLSTQIFNASGSAIRVNRAWERLWGVTMDAIPEYNILEDHQLEALGIGDHIRRAFAGDAVEIPAVRYDPDKTIPNRSRHADPVRWVRAFAYPVKDEAGQVREVVLVHEDVTAARQAQEMLQRSEERLRRALSTGRMNVWDWNLSTGGVECSENARHFWGHEVRHAAELLADIHPDDRGRVQEETRAALAGEGAFISEYRLVAADGGVRWVQSRGHVDRAPDGRAVRVLGVTIDITDLKTAEERMRLLADAGETLGASLDYELTLQNLARVLVPRLADSCAIDLLNDAGTLTRVSVHASASDSRSAVDDLFPCHPPPQPVSRGPRHVVATREAEWAPDLAADMLATAADREQPRGAVRGLGAHSYICVPLMARGACLGALTLVLGQSGRRYTRADLDLARDLARRAAAAVDNSRLYQQLRAEDRRKDEFLATLAHELRNPLAPIRTGLALLREHPDSGSAEKTWQIMDRQVGHMVRLIDDLLDLSRVTRGRVLLEKERVDLAAVIGTALEASRPLIDAAGLTFALTLPDTPVAIDADRTRLAQVLSNLLNNAAKYCDRGGRVELAAAVEDRDVVVRVTDTGVGIPREMLTEIFDMFAQVEPSARRSEGGLGIGLTLVKHLVELHGGRVWAESEGPARGSSFVIRLPLSSHPAQTAEPEAHGDALPPSACARRVLVVDDNADAADTLEALLTLAGHQVRTAGSGAEALELVREFHPEVAFLDIGMPGMTGYELARRLRRQPHLAGITLVAVTGWGQMEDLRRSEEAGFDHHLTKPVDPRQVRALLEGIPSAD